MHITGAGNRKHLKILILQWDPESPEALQPVRAAPVQQAGLTNWPGGSEEALDLVQGLELRAQGVNSFHHSQRGGGDGAGRFQSSGMTAVGLIEDGLSAGERGEDLGKKALIVHIPTRLGQPLRRFALRWEEKVIHVEQGTAVKPGQPGAQSGFPGGAGAVHGGQRPGVLPAAAVDGGQKGEQGRVRLENYPIGGGEGLTVGRTVSHHRQAGGAVLTDSRLDLLGGEGEAVQKLQAPVQPLRLSGKFLRSPEKQSENGGGGEPQSLTGGQGKAAQAASQGFCGGKCRGPLCPGPLLLQTGQSPAGVGDQVTAPHGALVQKFDGVPKLHARVVTEVLLQELRQMFHRSAFLRDRLTDVLDRHHQGGDGRQLQDNAGDGVSHRAGPEGCQREGIPAAHGQDDHDRAPGQTAGSHGGDQSGVDPAKVLGPAGVEQSGDQSVDGHLHGHGHGGGEGGGHPQNGGAHQRGQEAHCRPPGAAAEEAAQEGGQVHGQQHGADLRDISGEKGQYVSQGQHQGGYYQVLNGTVGSGHK